MKSRNFLFKGLVLATLFCLSDSSIVTAAQKSTSVKKVKQCWCAQCQNSWFIPKKHPYTQSEKIMVYLWQLLPHNGLPGQVPPLSQLILDYNDDNNNNLNPKESWLDMKSISGPCDNLLMPYIITSFRVGDEWMYSTIRLIEDESASFNSQDIEALRRLIYNPYPASMDYIKTVCGAYRLKADITGVRKILIKRQVRLDHVARVRELLLQEQKKENGCVIS